MPVGVVEHGSITSYLQLGIGYDYFCEQPKARYNITVYGHKIDYYKYFYA